MKTKILLIMLIFISINACRNQTKGVDNEPVTKQIKKPVANDSLFESAVIYEANIRQYSPEGTLNAFAKDIPELKKLGVKIIWLMPIYPISEVKRKAKGDVFVSDIKDKNERKKYLGSPYAVADYTAVNPDFGTKKDLDNLIAKAHENGMLVILDWVPNHTGWDHKWIKEHPDFYTHNKKGEITDPLNADGTSKGWQDVADLNYDNPEMRKAMITEMQYWIENHDIDGYRCDVAGEVPVRFWQQAIPQLRKIKPLFMLAEAWEPELLKEHLFDMCYGWESHFLLADIAKGKKTAEDFQKYMQKIDTMYEKDDIIMNFTANHDENSWKGTEEKTFGKATNLMRTLVFMMKGMPLIYSGQEYGLNHRLQFFEKDSISRQKGGDFALFEKLGQLKNTNPALFGGKKPSEYIKLDAHHDKILAFERKRGNDVVIFVGNMSDKRQDCQLDVSGTYLDYLNDKIIVGADNGNFKFSPGAWDYFIFILKKEKK